MYYIHMTTVIVPFDVHITWSDIGKFDEGNISEDMFRHTSKFQKGLIHLETPPIHRQFPSFAQIFVLYFSGLKFDIKYKYLTLYMSTVCGIQINDLPDV